MQILNLQKTNNPNFGMWQKNKAFPLWREKLIQEITHNTPQQRNNAMALFEWLDNTRNYILRPIFHNDKYVSITCKAKSPKVETFEANGYTKNCPFYEAMKEAKRQIKNSYKK